MRHLPFPAPQFLATTSLFSRLACSRNFINGTKQNAVFCDHFHLADVPEVFSISIVMYLFYCWIIISCKYSDYIVWKYPSASLMDVWVVGTFWLFWMVPWVKYSGATVLWIYTPEHIPKSRNCWVISRSLCLTLWRNCQTVPKWLPWV